MPSLLDLEAFGRGREELNAVIETAKGNRNKFKYDEELGLFRLRKTLPLGMVYPFDFGFVPSTRGDDGDPLDVLVLMDEPAFPGCLVASRLLGVVLAEQNEQGKTVSNDRLIAAATVSHSFREIRALDQLNQGLLDEIEHFFASYSRMEGKDWRPTGRRGPERARALVAEGEARFRRAGRGKGPG
jgi:inorganic pyrophosphatase